MAKDGLNQPPQHQAHSLVRDGLADIEDAAKFLSVCKATLYKLMDAGELTYTKLGKCRRIPWNALRDLAARNLKGA
jgi:excisionase family DNA binding protein